MVDVLPAPFLPLIKDMLRSSALTGKGISVADWKELWFSMVSLITLI
jgi:hypothetical protein